MAAVVTHQDKIVGSNQEPLYVSQTNLQVPRGAVPVIQAFGLPAEVILERFRAQSMQARDPRVEEIVKHFSREDRRAITIAVGTAAPKEVKLAVFERLRDQYSGLKIITNFGRDHLSTRFRVETNQGEKYIRIFDWKSIQGAESRNPVMGLVEEF